MYLNFNYFSLFTCPSLCRQDHFTVYIWYCIQAVSTDPGTYNWGPVYKYPFLFEKGVFFPSGFAYRLHVASEDSHGKRVFSKPLFRVEIFGKMLDTMASQCAFSHQRITIFSYISFSFGHLETIEKTQRVDGDFLNTEEKKSPFSNENKSVWTGPERDPAPLGLSLWCCCLLLLKLFFEIDVNGD